MFNVSISGKMRAMYLVSGSNVFGQWFLNDLILENFKIVSKNHNYKPELENFIMKDITLLHMSWSYNVFRCQNDLYVSGAWENDESVLKMLNMFFGFEALDLLVVGNNNIFCVVDAKGLKIWIYKTQPDADNTSLFCLDCLRFQYPQEMVGKGKNHTKVLKMIASNKSIYFLTNEGYVFTGIPPSRLDTSHCLGAVCDIACGYEHCILLTDFGRIYTWGSGKRFQLGHGNIEDVAKPLEVDALAGIRISKIAAGGYHCLALSEFGDAYSWGWNEEGQLGVFDSDKIHPSIEKPIEYSNPKLLDIYDENGEIVTVDIVDIACGSKHSALKLADNTVWTSGYNKYGQLGLPTKTFPCVKYFRKVYESCVDFNLMCGIWCTVIEIKKEE